MLAEKGIHIFQIKISVFRVTRLYLNLLVIPRYLFRFLDKNINLCILKGEMHLKIFIIIFFFWKKMVCSLRPVTRNTLIFFYLAYEGGKQITCKN